MLVTHGKKRNKVIYELQSKTNHSRESKCLKQFYAKFYLSPGQILNDQNLIPLITEWLKKNNK